MLLPMSAVSAVRRGMPRLYVGIKLAARIPRAFGCVDVVAADVKKWVF